MVLTRCEWGVKLCEKWWLLKRLLCCGALQGSADQAGTVGGSSLSTNGTGVQSELVNRVQLRYQCKVRTGMCMERMFSGQKT